MDEYEYLYNDLGKQKPSFTTENLFLLKFDVHTDTDSKISRISTELSFVDDNGTVYNQSIEVVNNKVLSYLGTQSDVPSEEDDIKQISLYDFVSRLDKIDFSYFESIISATDKYSLEFIHTSNVFYKNPEETERFLIRENSIIGPDLNDDIELDNYVPVLSFYGLTEVEENTYHSTPPKLIIYIDIKE